MENEVFYRKNRPEPNVNNNFIFCIYEIYLIIFCLASTLKPLEIFMAHEQTFRFSQINNLIKHFCLSLPII